MTYSNLSNATGKKSLSPIEDTLIRIFRQGPDHKGKLLKILATLAEKQNTPKDTDKQTTKEETKTKPTFLSLCTLAIDSSEIETFNP